MHENILLDHITWLTYENVSITMQMICNKHFKTQQYQQHSYLGLYINIHYKHKFLQHIHINGKYKILTLFYMHANYNQCIISIPINYPITKLHYSISSSQSSCMCVLVMQQHDIFLL
jgi:hypothetical protein